MAVVRIHVPTLREMVGAEFELPPLVERLGEELKGYEGDYALIDVNPDRPDLYSVEGLARAIKGLLEIELGCPKYRLGDSGILAKVRGVRSRPYVLFSVVKGVRLDDAGIRSLMELQEKLHATYGRRRRKVAIGIHDLDRVEGRLMYRPAKKDKFVPLGMRRRLSTSEILREHPKGREYGHILGEEHPVILDEKGVISFPPIINSARTAVTEDTRNFLIDVTGTDLRAVSKTLNIVTTALVERGGSPEFVTLKGGAMPRSPDLEPETVRFDRDLVRSLLGLPNLKGKAINIALFRMRITPKGADAFVPAYRTDIFGPVDLVEEVEKGLGLGALEPRLPKGYTIGRPLPWRRLVRKIRISMIGMGFLEVTTLTLTSPRREFDLMLEPRGDAVVLENPITEEHTILRTGLLPSILAVLSSNRGREMPIRVFEVGDAATPEGTRKLLAFAVMHPRAGLAEGLSVVSGLMASLGLEWGRRAGRRPSMIAGRVAEILVDGEGVGVVGEIHPQVLENFELEAPVVAGEFDVSKLLEKS
ncbi:MAG: phenylalanine--tRNA ligase subunit beta [Thermoplasmata archaeon]|nr:MAG: phenylalanine--tRNA ligase subunit beta [Thermoplasmata archaeon]